jgi:type I restriction enzyme S subunit
VTHQIIDGTHFTPNYLDGDTSQGVPFLRITDLQNKDIDLTNTKYISEEEHKELSKRCLPERGDLLLSKNGTIGLTKIVNWDYECSLFVSICLIKPIKRLIDVEYLNYYFQSDYMAYQFFHESKQITVTNLHLENIRDFLIVLPPLNEQLELAQILREKEEQFTNLRDKLNQQIGVLRAYRRSVIHEYVTGKKRVDMANTSLPA